MSLQGLRSWLRSWTVRSVSRWLSIGLPALWLLTVGYDKRWAGDDGLINLRVVRQLMAGNGFVYNAGERTEVVTSAAWVFVLWFAGELGFDLEKACWVLSLALSFAGVALAALASARLDEDIARPNTLVLPLGAAAYAVIPVASEYATSGLENGLGLAFLGGSYYLMSLAVTRDVGRARFAIAAFLGTSFLVRPDFALYGALFVAVLVVVTQVPRTRLLVALCAALPGAAYELFRMGYFACLVPNTALAKEAFAVHWAQGYWYLDNMRRAYALAVPLAGVLVALAWLCKRLLDARRPARAAVVLAMATGGLLHALYIIRVGGDFMHGRLLLPGLFGLFASVAVVRVPWRPSPASQRMLANTLRGAASWAAPIVTLAWAGYCAHSMHVEVHGYGINDERGYYVGTSGRAHPTRATHYREHVFFAAPYAVRERIAALCPGGDLALHDDARVACARWALPDGTEGVLSDHPPGELLPLEPSSTAPFVLGVVGFRPLGLAGLAVGLRMNIVDGYGLADSVGSRMEILQRGRPGHEKFFTTPYFAAKYLAQGATSDPRAIKARQVLGCGVLAELRAATHDPMTVRRFLQNLRLAFVLHRVRIPADPLEAERRFCS